MGIVKEHLVSWPDLDREVVIDRDEALILQGPRPPSMRPLPVGSSRGGGGHPGANAAAAAGDRGPGGSGGGRPDGAGRPQGGPPAGDAGPGGGPPGGRERRERATVEVVHVPIAWEAKPFSPPLWVYENEDVRVEHQDMNGRQPFYHRNTEVDEISYQVTGPRQLITEIGSVELEPGDFVNIPVGVAHDNWGRQEIHLLFYVKAPVDRQLEPVRFSTPHEFTAWEPAVVPEMISARDGGIVISTDERVLLAHANEDDRQLEVMHAGPDRNGAGGTRWAYRSDSFALGWTMLPAADGTEYRRTLNADEIQFQLEGKRTLITDLGCVDLEPGDFVRIPAGVAHASVARDSRHLTVHTARPLKRLVDLVRAAEVRSLEQIAEERAAVA
jgi:uncharacterized cupin superfamily protein